LTDIIRNANYFAMIPLDYDWLMEQALSEARKGLKKGEVPIGAVLAGSKGEIVARSYNQPISLKDPTAHAEILTLRSAGLYYDNYRLKGTTLVVTIEPCVMCMAAAIHGRISRLVYGAPDPKGGAAGSIFNLAVDRRFNHKIEVISGIREKECSRLLQDFFLSRRSA
jgi:tRNA(adenine34) deaminase